MKSRIIKICSLSLAFVLMASAMGVVSAKYSTSLTTKFDLNISPSKYTLTKVSDKDNFSDSQVVNYKQQYKDLGVYTDNDKYSLFTGWYKDSPEGGEGNAKKDGQGVFFEPQGTYEETKNLNVYAHHGYHFKLYSQNVEFIGPIKTDEYFCMTRNTGYEGVGKNVLKVTFRTNTPDGVGGDYGDPWISIRPRTQITERVTVQNYPYAVVTYWNAGDLPGSMELHLYDDKVTKDGYDGGGKTLGVDLSSSGGAADDAVLKESTNGVSTAILKFNETALEHQFSPYIRIDYCGKPGVTENNPDILDESNAGKSMYIFDIAFFGSQEEAECGAKQLRNMYTTNLDADQNIES